MALAPTSFLLKSIPNPPDYDPRADYPSYYQPEPEPKYSVFIITYEKRDSPALVREDPPHCRSFSDPYNLPPHLALTPVELRHYRDPDCPSRIPVPVIAARPRAVKKRVIAPYGTQEMLIRHQIDLETSSEGKKKVQDMAKQYGLSPSRVKVTLTTTPPLHPFSDPEIYEMHSQTKLEHANRLAVLNNWLDPAHNADIKKTNFDFDLINIPNTPDAYLERSAAHFRLGEYDKALKDFQSYQRLFPLAECIDYKDIGKELLQGIKDSAKGLWLFISDLVAHPIHSTVQLLQGLQALEQLLNDGSLEEIGEVLVPELVDLLRGWSASSKAEKVKQSAYIFGKYGADLLGPAVVFKLTSKGVKSAQALYTISKSLAKTENILVLESMATLKSGAKIKEVIEVNQKIITAGRELNYSARDLFKLKEAGKLEGGLNKVYEKMFQCIADRKSFELLEKAQEFLKPFNNKYMPESQAKGLIRQTGLNTYARSLGIPDNFRVCISAKGAGIKYVHPEHTHTSIRVMPGKPHSPLPHQQKPYVIYMKDGDARDILGNIVSSSAPEAHIPLEKVIYFGGK